MRKIRQKPKTKQVEEVIGKAIPSKSQDVKDRLRCLSELDEGRLMEQEDIEILTDYAAAADLIRKELEKDVKLIKSAIIAFARRTKTKKLTATKGSFTIGSSSSTEYGTPTQLVVLLKKYNKKPLFNDMVSLKITEIKRYLGEGILEEEGFMTKKTEEYGKVTLKTNK